MLQQIFLLLCIVHMSVVPPCFARTMIVSPALNESSCYQTSSVSGSENESSECYMINQALERLDSNDTLYLLPGIHMLTTFYIENNTLNSSLDLYNVSIIGNPDNRSTVVIQCSEGVGLVFLNIKNLTISGVTIEKCGLSVENFKEVLKIANRRVDIFFAPLNDFSTALFLSNCWNLFINSCTIRNNTGFGFVGVNLVGNTSFYDTEILSNFPSRCVVSLADYEESGGSGGGMLIVYQDYHPGNVERQTQILDTLLSFNNVSIKDNYCCRSDLLAVLHNTLARSISIAPRLTNDDGTVELIGAGGLSLFVAQGGYHVDATFDSCIFENNSSTYNGAALEITMYEAANDSHVSIFNSLFLNNGGDLVPEYGNQALDPAGSLLLVFYSQIPSQYSSISAASEFLGHTPSSVSIYGTKFISNTAVNGAGMMIFSFGPSVGFIQDEVYVENCAFINNSADHGAAIFATEISYSGFEPGVSVVFKNISVINNTEISVSIGIVNINFLDVTFNGTSYFLHNHDTALSLYSSVARMSGTFVFANNTGDAGGAIRLQTESYIVLADNVDILFDRNVGIAYGGAIYVNFDTIRSNLYDCFLFINEINPFCSLYNTCQLPRDNQVNITFINNFAQLGRNIYGSSFSSCPWINDNMDFFDQDLNGHEKLNLILKNLEFIENWVHLNPSSEGNTNDMQSGINTVAFSVINQDHVLNPVYFVKPGEPFSVNLSAFDQLLQPVPLTIFSRLTPNDGHVGRSHSSIGETDRYLLLGADDYNVVPITVYGYENTSYVLMITSNEAQVQFKINVNLEACAPGFIFNENITGTDLTDLRCLCAIDEEDIECVNNGSLAYPVNQWIGSGQNGNSTYYIIHECIFDYCQPGVTNINLESPDDQCRNNRTGILCGACKENYSRILGSTSCRLCENNNGLGYIFLFAALGIILVIVITVFNITITDGYLNGFIFYANIAIVYLYTLTPLENPRIIISFFNLYFGIPTCFYQGMTELWLVALDLVFPFYLGAILLVIVLITNYCRVRKIEQIQSKINVTHVFVTLLLLSYTSLIQTCFAILGHVKLDTGFGHSTRWRSDPNVSYFQDKVHLFLVFVSLILLMVLVPFAVLMLIPRTLLGLPLTKRLKPFIDACIAPFEPSKSFWIGLRLVVRLVVYLVAILGARETQLIILAVIITLLTILQAFLRPFKSTGRNIVDLSLLVNLSLLSIFTIYFLPQTLEEDNPNDHATSFFSFFFTACLLLLVAWYVIRKIPFTRRLYKGLKLIILNSVAGLKKKISEFKLITLMKLMKRKLRDKSNSESIGLERVSSKDRNHAFTHTSVALTNSSEVTQSVELYSGFRESLLGTASGHAGHDIY